MSDSQLLEQGGVSVADVKAEGTIAPDTKLGSITGADKQAILDKGFTTMLSDVPKPIAPDTGLGSITGEDKRAIIDGGFANAMRSYQENEQKSLVRTPEQHLATGAEAVVQDAPLGEVREVPADKVEVIENPVEPIDIPDEVLNTPLFQNMLTGLALENARKPMDQQRPIGELLKLAQTNYDIQKLKNDESSVAQIKAKDVSDYRDFEQFFVDHMGILPELTELGQRVNSYPEGSEERAAALQDFAEALGMENVAFLRYMEKKNGSLSQATSDTTSISTTT